MRRLKSNCVSVAWSDLAVQMVSPPGRDPSPPVGDVGDARDAMVLASLFASARAVPGDLLRLMERCHGLLEPGLGEISPSSGTDAGTVVCCCRKDASDASKSALSSVDEMLTRRVLGEPSFT